MGFARYGVGETSQALAARRVGTLPLHHREAIAQAWPTIAGAVEAAIDALGGERRVSRERWASARSARARRCERVVIEQLRAAIVAELGRIAAKASSCNYSQRRPRANTVNSSLIAMRCAAPPC